MKNYRSESDIMSIYCISNRTLDAILMKHKIDRYKGKVGLMINILDFHKVYTSIYNPTLFSELDKKSKTIPRKPEEVEELLKFGDTNGLFSKVFSTPSKKTKLKNSIRNKNLFI